jgi:hypothetical protein
MGEDNIMNLREYLVFGFLMFFLCSWIEFCAEIDFC